MDSIGLCDDYHPTLWRTCRVLANKQRLLCLKTVINTPQRSVGEVAEICSLPPHKVSMHLRALQSRGLLHASRQSRWVRYAPDPDPLVPCARPILYAMQIAFATLNENEVLRTLTAFTHPRRLAILYQLQTRPSISEDLLSVVTQISSPALWRHLKKLESRNLVAHSEGTWSLHGAPPRLAHTFLTLIALASLAHRSV